MRKLQSQDVFAAARLLKHAEVKQVLAEVALKKPAELKKDLRKVGFDILIDMIANISKPEAEKAFYEFLSGPLELKPEEIKKMDLLELINMIKEFISFIDSEEWKGFFRYLRSLMK